MSTDWSKYRTPEETRMGKGVERAAQYGVTGFNVGTVRRIEELTVIHVPLDDNDAHSHVLGLSKDDEILTRQRLELYDACAGKLLVAPSSPVAHTK